MSLLVRLQSTLNKLYDGNVTTIDPIEGVSHKDAYKCDCGAIVHLDEWSEEYKLCCDCYLNMLEDNGHKWGKL